MFTGIVEATATVESLVPRGDVQVLTLAVEGFADLAPGASIAVNGCCLSAVTVRAGGFTCDLTRETLERTGFADRLRPGERVNLERPLRADGRFDGHLVQGHVDGLGTVLGLVPSGEAAELTVAPPPELQRYLVEKGSVAVEGVSLTVARLAPGAFTVALIPYTLRKTSLADRRPGDRVNLEADVVAKYVERLLSARSS